MFAELSNPQCFAPKTILQSFDDVHSQAAIDIIRTMLPEVLAKDTVQVIPVSGGADSAALAILLVTAFPEVNFRLMFTDTGAEPNSVYETLDCLESFTGRLIERVAPEKSLYGYVDQFNGFLPSARDRWCTRVLKLQPYQRWIKQFGEAPLNMYVGVRADEDRIAFVAEGVQTLMPFVTLGINRELVFAILSKTIGIPSLYKQRTRSGCGVCPFQRGTEVIAMLEQDPQTFQQGRSMEKLNVIDVKSFSSMPEPFWKTSGLARNWLGFPQPDWSNPESGIAATRSRVSQVPADLFGGAMQGIWVAVEFWVHDSYLEPIVWRQELVAVSTTRNGLQKQLDMHMQHRLKTAEVWYLTEEEMQNEVRFVMYYLNVEADALKIQRPSEGSYTWQQGQSYARTEHLVRWGQAALWSIDTGVAPVVARGNAPVRIELLGQEVYQPKPPSVDDMYDERFIACPMCSM